MPRLRRYLPPLLMLLPLIFICGKLLLQPVEGQAFSGQSPFCKRGWPWAFQYPYVDLGDSFVLFRGLQISPIDFGLLAADIAVLVAIISAFILLMIRHRRRAGRWFKFSLRSLLLLTALCGVLFGVWAKVVYDWKREQQTLAEWENAYRSYELTWAGPDWLRRLVPRGDQDIFKRVTWLQFEWSAQSGVRLQTAFPAALERLRFVKRLGIFCPDASTTVHLDDLAPLSEIEWLDLDLNAVDEDTVRWVGKLPRLEDLIVFNYGDREHPKDVWNNSLAHLTNGRLRSLTLHVPHINERGIDHLAKLSKLESLDFSPECPITKEMLRSLARLQSLRQLSFSEAQFAGDAGLECLKEIPNLKSIDLHDTNVTDAGIEALKQCPALETLDLGNCEKLTDRGLRQLLEYPCLQNVCLDRATATDETWQLLKKRIPHLSEFGVSTVATTGSEKSN